LVKIAFDPIYAHPLPAGHRFPMVKYELVPEQLLHEGAVNADHFFRPRPCPDDVILWTHEKEYLDDLKNLRLSPSHIRRIGFPLTNQLVERELVITQGTIDCCHYALQFGVALNVAGGTHHAFANRGEGFCLLNDMAVAANYLLHHQLTDRIMIVDLDVHQGNGTAGIFSEEPRVFTFSMHGGHNYPFVKEKSDLDIPLADGIEDEEYLNLLSENLSRLIKEQQPSFIFYLSGADVLFSDKYGKLKLSLEGCRKRDEFVFEICRQNKIPCAVAMGGGYSADIKMIVEAHCNTFREAVKQYE
jgi:acetoin utilization deacetylase AcuC-like enzyme